MQPILHARKGHAVSALHAVRRTELNVMQKVHFPHAVQFLGASTLSQPYMIVTEFLPGGSLMDLFKRVHRGLACHPSLKRATEMALDCARGMTYLHAKK
jgi:serine/threonine protein kinase